LRSNHPISAQRANDLLKRTGLVARNVETVLYLIHLISVPNILLGRFCLERYDNRLMMIHRHCMYYQLVISCHRWELFCQLPFSYPRRSIFVIQGQFYLFSIQIFLRQIQCQDDNSLQSQLWCSIECSPTEFITV